MYNYVSTCSEGSNVVYKHYAIGMSASEFQTEGVVSSQFRYKLLTLAFSARFLI